MYTKCWFSGAQ